MHALAGPVQPITRLRPMLCSALHLLNGTAVRLTTTHIRRMLPG